MLKIEDTIEQLYYKYKFWNKVLYKRCSKISNIIINENYNIKINILDETTTISMVVILQKYTERYFK